MPPVVRHLVTMVFAAALLLGLPLWLGWSDVNLARTPQNILWLTAVAALCLHMMVVPAAHYIWLSAHSNLPLHYRQWNVREHYLAYLAFSAITAITPYGLGFGLWAIWLVVSVGVHWRTIAAYVLLVGAIQVSSWLALTSTTPNLWWPGCVVVLPFLRLLLGRQRFALTKTVATGAILACVTWLSFELLRYVANHAVPSLADHMIGRELWRHLAELRTYGVAQVGYDQSLGDASLMPVQIAYLVSLVGPWLSTGILSYWLVWRWPFPMARSNTLQEPNAVLLATTRNLMLLAVVIIATAFQAEMLDRQVSIAVTWLLGLVLWIDWLARRDRTLTTILLVASLAAVTVGLVQIAEFWPMWTWSTTLSGHAAIELLSAAALVSSGFVVISRPWSLVVALCIWAISWTYVMPNGMFRLLLGLAILLYCYYNSRGLSRSSRSIPLLTTCIALSLLPIEQLRFINTHRFELTQIESQLGVELVSRTPESGPVRHMEAGCTDNHYWLSPHAPETQLAIRSSARSNPTWSSLDLGAEAPDESLQYASGLTMLVDDQLISIEVTSNTIHTIASDVATVNSFNLNPSPDGERYTYYLDEIPVCNVITRRGKKVARIPMGSVAMAAECVWLTNRDIAMSHAVADETGHTYGRVSIATLGATTTPTQIKPVSTAQVAYYNTLAKHPISDHWYRAADYAGIAYRWSSTLNNQREIKVKPGIRGVVPDSTNPAIGFGYSYVGHITMLDFDKESIVAEWDVGPIVRHLRWDCDGQSLLVASNTGLWRIRPPMQ